MSRDAVCEKTRGRSQGHGMLRTGRGVVDPAGDFGTVRGIAGLRTRSKIVLKGAAVFAEIMPEPEELSPLPCPEDGRKAFSIAGCVVEMNSQGLPIFLGLSGQCMRVRRPWHGPLLLLIVEAESR